MNLIIMVDSTTVRASPRSLPVPTCIEVSLTPRRTGIPHSSYEGPPLHREHLCEIAFIERAHHALMQCINAGHHCDPRPPQTGPCYAYSGAVMGEQLRRPLARQHSFSMRRPSSQCCHRRRCWRTNPPRSCRPWRRGSWPWSGWSGLSARRRCSPPCPSR